MHLRIKDLRRNIDPADVLLSHHTSCGASFRLDTQQKLESLWSCCWFLVTLIPSLRKSSPGNQSDVDVINYLGALYWTAANPKKSHLGVWCKNQLGHIECWTSSVRGIHVYLSVSSFGHSVIIDTGITGTPKTRNLWGLQFLEGVYWRQFRK